MSQKTHIRRFLLVLCAVWALCPSDAAAGPSYEVIYVAGNPSFYPVEYYDPDSGSYLGAMPLLLEQISEKTGLRFEYLHPGQEDRREELARNCQVELVSGYYDGSFVPTDDTIKSLPCFTFKSDGREQTIRFLFTAAAEPPLRSAFEQALASIPAAERANIALSAAVAEQPSSKTSLWVPSLSLLSALLFSALILLYRKAVFQKRKHAADQYTDELTGLGNLKYFEKYFNQLIGEHNRALYCLVSFSIGVPRIQRLQGGREADAALKYTALVLNEHCTDTDFLARVGDDCFLLAHQSTGERELQTWLTPILHKLGDYGERFGKDYTLESRAGVYYLRPEDRSCEGAILHAQQACEEALNRGAGYVLSDPRMISDSVRDRQFMHQTRPAIEKRQFILYLHLIVFAQSEHIWGGEALIRWQHPQRGLLSPSQFIALMEREGTIGELDYYVLTEVCQLLGELNELGVDDKILSCNLSRLTLADPAFRSRVEQILSSYRFLRGNLILEITESALAKSQRQGVENIGWLRQQGLKIALDDFGSGYTSFADMNSYAADYLKIDKSVVDGALDPRGQKILAGLIRFGHDLDVKVLCEGIESQEQAELIRRLSGDYIQGYYFYQPMPAVQARQLFLEQHKKGNIE